MTKDQIDALKDSLNRLDSRLDAAEDHNLKAIRRSIAETEEMLSKHSKEKDPYFHRALTEKLAELKNNLPRFLPGEDLAGRPWWASTK